MFSIVTNPKINDLVNFLNYKLFKEVIIIFANCKIEYFGRAKSLAENKPRLIIIKVDGTVIVHESTKREPVNWQPSGSKITLEANYDKLNIVVERNRPREVLKIILNEVYYITSAIVAESDLKFFGSEEEMINLVIKNPHYIEEGFKPLKWQLRTPYGIVDLIGLDKNNNYLVLEFKRSMATLQSVSQLYRYYLYFKENFLKVRGGIVAPKISANAEILLKKLNLEFFKLDPSQVLL